MKLPIEPLSQNDTRWKLKKLGTSTSTIGSSGCVITCVSMLLTYYKHSTTPDILNTWLIANNGYSDTNLLKWEIISNLYSDIKFDQRIDCPKTPAPLDLVDSYLNASKPVIALVDFDPKIPDTQQHFVLLIGKDNGSYFCNDPWTGETYYFEAKYGNPSAGICGLRLYSGPVPSYTYDVIYNGQVLATYETNPTDTIVTLTNTIIAKQNEIADKATELSVLGESLKALREELERQTKYNEQMVAERNTARTERDNAITDFTQKLAIKDSEHKKELDQTIQVSADKEKSLSASLSEVVASKTALENEVIRLKAIKPIEKMTNKEILSYLLKRITKK